MRPVDPLDELASDVRDQVLRTGREIQSLGGAISEQPGGAVNRAAADLARALHHVHRADPAGLATTDGIGVRRARLEEAIRQVDEFAGSARQGLDAALSLLGDVEDLVAADERRRSAARVEAERRRRVEHEVGRIEAAEEAERQRRLEQEAEARVRVAEARLDAQVGGA